MLTDVIYKKSINLFALFLRDDSFNDIFSKTAEEK